MWVDNAKYIMFERYMIAYIVIQINSHQSNKTWYKLKETHLLFLALLLPHKMLRWSICKLLSISDNATSNSKKGNPLTLFFYEIIKENARSLSFPLAKIINQAIRQGLVPAELKKTWIKPI